MKSITSRLVMVAVTMSIFLMWSVYYGQSIVVAQQPKSVEVTRMYTGADGLSHIDQVNVKFPPGASAAPTTEESESVKVTRSYIVRAAPGAVEGWHNADARRYVVPVSGRTEVEVAGGRKFMVEPGRIYIAEDVTGKGHTFRVVGDQDWVALFVGFAQ
jgi:hypothetical protein